MCITFLYQRTHESVAILLSVSHVNRVYVYQPSGSVIRLCDQSLRIR